MRDDGKIHISRLKLFGRSPAHYKGAVDKDEYFLERGTAVHSLLLGGDRVIGYPGAVRRGKEWDAFEAANQDAIILTKAEYGKAEAIAASVRRDPLAMSLLEGQSFEVTVEWVYLGRACSSRVDVVGDHIAELKCVADASPQRFMWQAVRMGWFAQLAFYQEACAAKHKTRLEDLYIVAVESAPPHVTACYRLDERAVEFGRKQFRGWFERLLMCESANEFPGYCQSVMPLSAPDEESELVFPSDPEPTEEAA